MVFDYITTRPVKDSAKEQVRQRTAHAIPKEFGISLADMTIDFPIAVGGRKRKADIVVFSHGTEHTLENVQRVVLVKPEPTKRSAAGLRSHEQAVGECHLGTPLNPPTGEAAQTLRKLIGRSGISFCCWFSSHGWSWKGVCPPCRWADA